MLPPSVRTLSSPQSCAVRARPLKGSAPWAVGDGIGEFVEGARVDLTGLVAVRERAHVGGAALVGGLDAGLDHLIGHDPAHVAGEQRPRDHAHVGVDDPGVGHRVPGAHLPEGDCHRLALTHALGEVALEVVAHRGDVADGPEGLLDAGRPPDVGDPLGGVGDPLGGARDPFGDLAGTLDARVGEAFGVRGRLDRRLEVRLADPQRLIEGDVGDLGDRGAQGGVGLAGRDLAPADAVERLLQPAHAVDVRRVDPRGALEAVEQRVDLRAHVLREPAGHSPAARRRA